MRLIEPSGDPFLGWLSTWSRKWRSDCLTQVSSSGIIQINSALISCYNSVTER